jgi:hypothetical protein
MIETVSVITVTEATATEAIHIVSLIASDRAAATWTASDGDETAAEHDLQTRTLTRMMKVLLAIVMEAATAAATILLIVPVVAVVRTAVETTTVAADVLAPGPLVALVMKVVTDIVSGTVLVTAVDVMTTAAVVAALPHLRKIKTTVTSVLSSCSRFHSVQRPATSSLSSKPLAPSLKPKLSRTV